MKSLYDGYEFSFIAKERTGSNLSRITAKFCILRVANASTNPLACTSVNEALFPLMSRKVYGDMSWFKCESQPLRELLVEESAEVVEGVQVLELAKLSTQTLALFKVEKEMLHYVMVLGSIKFTCKCSHCSHWSQYLFWSVSFHIAGRSFLYGRRFSVQTTLAMQNDFSVPHELTSVTTTASRL